MARVEDCVHQRPSRRGVEWDVGSSRTSQVLFHGDNDAGLGAMHQTGWTALVVDLILDPPSRATPFAGG